MADSSNLKSSIYTKTILMLLVIFGHACAFWSGHWFTENPIICSGGLSLLYSWINSFHIYAFALVSGYIFTFKIMRGGYSKFLLFLTNKAKRLLIPYVFVMLIWVAPISAFFFNWDLAFLAKKYLLAIDPSQLWFLWMLFGVFVIVWPMRKVLLEKPVVGWAIALCFYGIGLIGRRLISNVFCIWTACQYVLFFFVGMRIRAKEEKRENMIIVALPSYCWIMIDLLLFVATRMIDRNNGTAWSLIAIVLNLILHIVGAVMAWAILQVWANKVKWKDSKAFNALSSYSMPMYLFHQQIIYFTIIWLNGKVNPWINALVNFVVAVIVTFLISSILMRWKVTRFLIGEKA